MIAWDLIAAVPDMVQTVGHFVSLLPSSDYSDSDEGGAGWLLAAGPAAGTGVYWMLYRHYRNTDKSHQFEQETIIESQPVTGADTKVNHVKGTSRSSIEGANGRRYRQRVQRTQ